MLASSDKDRLLFIPGPTPVTREILDALAEPTISHTSGELAGIMTRTLEQLGHLMDNRGGPVFAFAGSGTLAQEAAIVNFVEPGQTLLVASNGYFGDRMADIARAHQFTVVTIQARWGSSVQPAEIEECLSSRAVAAVAFTHVETSTGAMTPLKETLEVIKASGALSIVDGVAAFGGVPESMNELGIDVLLTGAQKALGVPPGLAILGIGEEAWKRREQRTSPISAYYVDLMRWYPIMKRPDAYFSTHSVNMLYALGRAMSVIFDEGLSNRFARHASLARRFREGMLGLGFTSFTDEEFLAPTLSVLRTPAGTKSTDFRARLHARGVVAAGGIQDAEDSVVRFGHMGNISGAEIAVALDAATRAMADEEAPASQ